MHTPSVSSIIVFRSLNVEVNVGKLALAFAYDVSVQIPAGKVTLFPTYDLFLSLVGANSECRVFKKYLSTDLFNFNCNSLNHLSEICAESITQGLANLQSPLYERDILINETMRLVDVIKISHVQLYSKIKSALRPQPWLEPYHGGPLSKRILDPRTASAIADNDDPLVRFKEAILSCTNKNIGCRIEYIVEIDVGELREQFRHQEFVFRYTFCYCLYVISICLLVFFLNQYDQYWSHCRQAAVYRC